jgi:hypothetical protein
VALLDLGVIVSSVNGHRTLPAVLMGAGITGGAIAAAAASPHRFERREAGAAANTIASVIEDRPAMPELRARMAEFAVADAVGARTSHSTAFRALTTIGDAIAGSGGSHPGAMSRIEGAVVGLRSTAARAGHLANLGIAGAIAGGVMAAAGGVALIHASS